MRDDHERVFHIAVTKELYDRVCAMAAQEDRSRLWMLRRLIREGLDGRGVKTMRVDGRDTIGIKS
jgi:ribbon-helix-helix CopG family protein